MKVKKLLLKTFRRKSSTVKIFCSDTHLKLFDILQVCYNKIVVIKIPLRTLKLQKNSSN